MDGAPMRDLLPVDLTVRYFQELAHHAWLLVPAALVALVVGRQGWPAPVARAGPWIRRVALVLVVGGAALWAWSLLWASDDAYISFRYAENLARGRGLVFNPGERVEGYTDFLWTVIMAAVVRAGADPAQVAIVLSLLSFLALLLILHRLGRQLAPEPAPLLGLAAIVAAGSYTLASFATSGLETMFASLLVLLALERAESRRPLQAGLAGVLAAMAHPDHAIFYAALGLALALDWRRRRELLFYLVPVVVVFAPYFLWRWRYYGDLMPNTFYAKSADQTYFSQGGTYLLITFISGGLWAAAPLAVLGALHLRRELAGRFALIGLPLYLLYVAKIGGDFMLGRLFTPVLAVVFLLAEVGLTAPALRERPKTRVALALLALLAALPVRVIRRGEIYSNVADERSFVVVTRWSPIEVNAYGFRLGKALRATFTDRGVTPTMGLYSIGMSSYYSDLPVFDLRGLTSRSVAHSPLLARGRPGHEKEASLGHILEAGVDISELPAYPEPYRPLSHLFVAGGDLSLVRYDPRIVSVLPPSSRLADFPRYLDGRLPRLGSEGPARLDCDLWHLREYYLSRNQDPARRSAAIDATVLADPQRAAVAPLLLETRELDQLGWRRVRSFAFEAGDRSWKSTGQGSLWWRSEAVPEQGRPFGQRGAFIDSFTSRDRDGSTGSLTSEPFTIEGQVMTLLVGGGLAPQDATVELLVDGHPVRTATGCDSEWLGRRVWDLAPYRGKQGTLVISDRSGRGWAHLLVDEIVEWGRAAPSH
jgi:hypothetical protein